MVPWKTKFEQITIVEVYCNHTIQYLVKQNPIWLFLNFDFSKEMKGIVLPEHNCGWILNQH